MGRRRRLGDADVLQRARQGHHHAGVHDRSPWSASRARGRLIGCSSAVAPGALSGPHVEPRAADALRNPRRALFLQQKAPQAGFGLRGGGDTAPRARQPFHHVGYLVFRAGGVAIACLDGADEELVAAPSRAGFGITLGCEHSPSRRRAGSRRAPGPRCCRR
jgi:hypothetical protein